MSSGMIKVKDIFVSGDNAARPGSFRPGPHKARTTWVGSPRPTSRLKILVRPAYSLVRGPAHFSFLKKFLIFFLIFMIKLSMFKNWEL